MLFNNKYTPVLNDDDLIVIEDIIEVYKADGIGLSHKEAYAGIYSWHAQRSNAIDWKIDKLYPKEVKAVLIEYRKGMDSWTPQNSNLGAIGRKRRDAARELTERMVQEHYNAEDQFIFMMATGASL